MEKKNNVLYVNIYFMEKEKILTYEAPVVEIIEVEVEKGFALSPNENKMLFEFMSGCYGIGRL